MRANRTIDAGQAAMIVNSGAGARACACALFNACARCYLRQGHSWRISRLATPTSTDDSHTDKLSPTPTLASQ
jgi:hypothetical protein